MHALVDGKRQEIGLLCRRFGVRRLDVFGSILGDSFDPATSDVDVLVEFDTHAGFDYFVVSATSMRNPYFRDQVMRTRERLYAA